MKKMVKQYGLPVFYLLLILVIYFSFGFITKKIIKDNRNHYDYSVSEQISTDMEWKIQNYIDKMESMKSFVEETKVSGIDYNEFYMFSSGLFENDESIVNISIAPNAVHEFIYPVEYNNMVGYNLLEDDRNYVVEAVTRAINNNEIVVSGPYTMRQDDTKSIVVIRYPVYYDDGDFYGLINVVVQTTTLFKPVESEQYNDIKFQIIDSNQAILYGAELYDDSDTIESIQLDYFGWEIVFGHSKLYSNSILKDDRNSDILFFSGFIFLLVGGIIFVITNGKSKLEKGLVRRSEILLQSSLESFKDIIISSIDLNYCYLYFNKVHKDTMKKLYNEEIEIGKNIFDYINSEEDKNILKISYDLALSGKSHTIIEEYGEKQRNYFELSYSPIYNDENKIIGITVFARDISRKVKQENDLRYEKELAQQYLSLAGTIILVLDTKGNVTLINKKGCQIIGLKEKEIIGKNWFDNFIPKETIGVIKEVFKNVFSEKIHLDKHFENIIITSKSEERIIAWDNNVLYDSNGKITGVISSGEDVTEIREKEDELIKMSYKDSLTGLYNRRYLFENIDKLWRQSIRKGKVISFIMIDIDDFKLYNDSYGHIEGDHVLMKVATEFESSMTRPFDIVGRYGGEEFMVVLPNTTLEGAYKVAEKIRNKVINLCIVHSEECNSEFLSISLGVTALIPDKDSKIEETINKADIALFKAKEKGKNRTEKYLEKI